MPSQMGVPHAAAAMCASLLVFRPEWEERLRAGPRSALAAVLLIVGILVCGLLGRP